jgi:hypothetical protein
LQPGVASNSQWKALIVFLALLCRFLFGLLRRIAEGRVQVLPLLRHNADPHHIDGHAAILARPNREARYSGRRLRHHLDDTARNVASFGFGGAVLPVALGRCDVGRTLPSVRGMSRNPAADSGRAAISGISTALCLVRAVPAFVPLTNPLSRLYHSLAMFFSVI